MDDSGKFLEKMMELGIGMSMIQQMPVMMRDVMQPSESPIPPSLPTSTNTLLQSSAHIYIAVDNKQAGPFTEDELIKLIKNDLFQPQTLVWKAGMTTWLPASQLADVNKLFILAKLK